MLPPTSTMPYPEQDFVLQWLAQKNRNAKMMSGLVTGATLIFAAIAAWPIIRAWFG